MSGVILVPHDFSESATAALSFATTLAQRLGARIELVHVYPDLEAQLAPETFPVGELVPELRRSAGVRCDQELEAPRAAGVECGWRTEVGDPSRAIAAVARELGADLIVMGTRGLGGLQHVLLGSVAERIVRIAPCPVVTVRGDASDDAPAD